MAADPATTTPHATRTASAARDARAAAGQSHGRGRRRRRVLLATGNDDLRQRVVAGLSSGGDEVIVATSASRTVDALRGDVSATGTGAAVDAVIDAVIIDLGLCGDGVETLERVRAACPHLPVVVTSRWPLWDEGFGIWSADEHVVLGGDGGEDGAGGGGSDTEDADVERIRRALDRVCRARSAAGETGR